MARQIYLQTIRSSMVRPHTQCHVHTQYHKVKSIKHGQTDLPANSQAWPDHIHSAMCNEAYTILQARLSRSGMACQAWPDYKQRLVRHGLTDDAQACFSQSRSHRCILHYFPSHQPSRAHLEAFSLFEACARFAIIALSSSMILSITFQRSPVAATRLSL